MPDRTDTESEVLEAVYAALLKVNHSAQCRVLRRLSERLTEDENIRREIAARALKSEAKP